MKILIVDDREDNRYMLEALLKGNGYDTQSVSNGAEALEQLKSGKIDLIISDILMPVMDGFELCRKVRTDESTRNIPFIIYTATYTGPQDEKFAIKIGADRFIIKPCEPDLLLKAVGDVISSSKNRKDDLKESPQEEEVLKLYNERLVRKLEQKMLQLEKEIQTRQIAEEKLSKLNRIYAVLSEINKAIVRIDNQQVLFDDVCRIAVETGEFSFCWIGIADSRSGNLTTAAQCCLPGDYADNINTLLSADEPESVWPEENVLPEGEYYICNDIGKDESMLHRRENALKPGYRSYAAFPLTRFGAAYAVINFYSSQTGFFDEQEVNLLKELSSDISYCIETIESEKQKQRIEEERDRFFNNSIDMMLVAGFDGHFKQLNPAWERTLGWTNKELMSKPYIEFIHPEDIETTLRTIEDLTRGEEKKINFLNRFQCKDGTYKWLSWNFVTIKEENLIFAVTRDVSEQVRNENERKKLEAQLIQAQKLESLGTMAGGIAHDFNNILNIIMGYTSTLDSVGTDENELHKITDIILDASRRGAGLVKQLLTFARKSETVFQSVQVNNIIDEIKKFIKETFPKTIQINSNLEENIPVIIADSTQIHQVLLNLCINARDAMQKGGTLTISTKRMKSEEIKIKKPVNEAREYIEIKFEDSGSGIDEEIREKIFEPFFTTKETGKGTGLGLAIVYGIINNHGGFIDVESEKEIGTTFYIYLPVQEETTEIQQLSLNPDKNMPQGVGTILLIEDEKVSNEMLTTILVLKGFKVITAYDGLQGIMAYQNHRQEIAVVISDLGLPRLGGDEVYKQIKTMNPDAKIILISGDTDPEVKARLFEAGARHIIYKPYLPAIILQALKNIIEDK